MMEDLLTLPSTPLFEPRGLWVGIVFLLLLGVFLYLDKRFPPDE